MVWSLSSSSQNIAIIIFIAVTTSLFVNYCILSYKRLLNLYVVYNWNRYDPSPATSRRASPELGERFFD